MKIKEIKKELIGIDMGLQGADDTRYQYRVIKEDGSFELYTKEQAYEVISLAGKLTEAMGGQGY